ncbi:glycosyltransferase family 2 protein [Flavobacterium paronense]|uniref:Glycosyltransferase family 2 protein n=1 Tax=Flavobacterium paronense TaxID=1392775 RepID=A0ABV5GAL7_9FLAO|nr:glycosyltransferase family 2 protein [Flavobacterium paronense]MDN3676671.1 glycosyltransferase family 2 protein [Flavobacterium paronense]
MHLSIIIPVYNVEDYIEKCIRSLENQDIPKTDFEIIVTNDGSPDNCKAIVERLQVEFSNLILVNQENQGVSMARNNAIALAKGKYILPIDPDDYVLPNTLGSVLDLAEQHQLDVLYLGFEIFNASGKSVWHTDYSNQEGTIYDGVEGYFVSRGYAVRDPDRSWAMLYRREMLQHYSIHYPKDVPYLEDGLFLAKVFTVANRVGFENKKFYQRTTRAGSATNSRLFYSEKAIQGFIKAVQDVKQFSKQFDFNQKQRGLVNHVVAKFVFLSLAPSTSSFQFRRYFAILKILKQANLNILDGDGVRFLYRSYVKVYNISKLIFLFYFRFYKK